MSMKRYLDRFETCFTESIMLAKSIVENNKCITYLKNMVRDGEEKIRRVETSVNEDMALLKINNKRQLSIYELKVDKLEKKEKLDIAAIVDLKKELEIVKNENEGVIANLHKGLKDITAYQQMHAQLLSSENSVIKDGIRDDQKSASSFSDFLRTVGNELKQNLNGLIGELKTMKSTIAEQSGTISSVLQNIKSVDHQERSIFKQEMENFKKSLFNVRNLILGDQQAVQDTIIDLKLFIDQLGRNTDSIAQDFEKQVNRFIELNKINESRM